MVESELEKMEDMSLRGEKEEVDNEVVEGDAANAEKPKKKKNKKKKKTGSKQTEPPTIPVSKLFPDNNFPIGEIQEYANEYLLSYVAIFGEQRVRKNATWRIWRRIIIMKPGKQLKFIAKCVPMHKKRSSRE
jgi:hypothetical protein